MRKRQRILQTRESSLFEYRVLKLRNTLLSRRLARRIAIGNFQELNIIVKGDVDGSIEALSDSLIKLSTKRFMLM
jgi:translation initiation factor IF-2